VPASADRPATGAPRSDALEGALVLRALDDADCRAILGAVDDRARSAREIAETCDLPTSTTYRKLDRVAAAGLVSERTQVALDGTTHSEYRTAVAAVRVSLESPDGFAVTVAFRDERPPVTVSLSG